MTPDPQETTLATPVVARIHVRRLTILLLFTLVVPIAVAVLIDVTVSGGVLNSSATGRFVAVGVGVDSASVNSAQQFGGQVLNTHYVRVQARYQGYPGLGRHYLAWLEAGAGADTQTWLGDNGAATMWQSGIVGTVWM